MTQPPQPSPSENAADRKGEVLLVAVANQLSKLVQLHQLTETALGNLPEALALETADAAKADAVKREAIANIFMLLTAYYQSQGWDSQELKALISHALERYRQPQPGSADHPQN